MSDDIARKLWASVRAGDARLKHEGRFASFAFAFTAQARLGAHVLLVKVENDAICGG